MFHKLHRWTQDRPGPLYCSPNPYPSILLAYIPELMPTPELCSLPLAASEASARAGGVAHNL